MLKSPAVAVSDPAPLYPALGEILMFVADTEPPIETVFPLTAKSPVEVMVVDVVVTSPGAERVTFPLEAVVSDTFERFIRELRVVP